MVTPFLVAVYLVREAHVYTSVHVPALNEVQVLEAQALVHLGIERLEDIITAQA